MTIPSFLSDSVCSWCKGIKFRLVSDGAKGVAPVIKDSIIHCVSCGADKCSGLKYDEAHNSYHEAGQDPTGLTFPSSWRGTA